MKCFDGKKKLQNSALLMLIDSEPTPPNTHTHKNNHLIEFLPLPSVSHLIVSPRRDFVQRGTNLKASNTESLDRKFSLFFFIYASNVNYQWTAEGQNLLSLQL